MQRLKTRPQFQAAMAGGTVSRTAHFALHRLVLGADGTAPDGRAVVASGPVVPAAAVADPAAAIPAAPPTEPTGPGVSPQALFALSGVWLGAMVPKRWARRAVTRNTIKRQIYTVGATFEARLAQVAPQSAHVVRLRSTFDRKQFISATSDQLRQAVRAELLQLFNHAAKRPGASGGASGGAHAGSSASAQGSHGSPGAGSGGTTGRKAGKSPGAPRVSAVAP